MTALKRTSALVAPFLLERDASLMDPKRNSRGPLGYDKRIEDEVRKVRGQLPRSLPG